MYYLSLLVIFLIYGLSPSTQRVYSSTEILWSKGQKIEVSGDVLEDCEQTRKRIKQKYEQNDKKTYQEALRQIELFQQQYQDKISGENAIKKVRIPRRWHIDGHVEHKAKTRLLKSTNNQYPQIDQGNNGQVTDLNFVYSLRDYQVFAHKVQGSKLTQISILTFEFPLSPREIHASQGFLAIIFQSYQPNATVVRVYQNSGSNLTQIRQYKKEGLYIASREYNQYLLILVEQEMKSPDLDYTWTVSGVGDVQQNLYEGVSANKTAKNHGNAARFFGKIPLGPANNTNYQFATYLLCDFAWDIVLTPQLHVFAAGNYYNSSGYAVSIQQFKFQSEKGKPWGSSRWIILPGLINSKFQIHEFNKYLRVALLYVDGDWNTIGHVSLAKIPYATFDPKDGELYRNLGINGSAFTACRFVKDSVFLIFRSGIKTFSTSLGITTDNLQIKQIIYHLYPYGPKYLVGFGMTEGEKDVALVIFQSNGYKLTLKQSLALVSQRYSYSLYSWLENQFLQFNWETKRITFPISTSEKEPYKKGYFQIYSDPVENCLSVLPVPNPCPASSDVQVPIVGKLFKHWDQGENYDYQTGQSQQIRRSSTIFSDGKYVLITGSPCQLQARIIQPIHETPMMTSTNTSQVSFFDLCK